MFPWGPSSALHHPRRVLEAEVWLAQDRMVRVWGEGGMGGGLRVEGLGGKEWEDHYQF